MKFSEAWDLMLKAWVPGVFQHYSVMRPDPWSDNNDMWGSSFNHPDLEYRSRATERWNARCLELINAYKALKSAPSDVSLLDAFIISDGEKIADWRRKLLKDCRKCGTNKQIRVYSRADDRTDVCALCQTCRDAQSKYT